MMTVEVMDNITDGSPENVLSFAFGGTGFLGVYQVGVAACLKEHTNVVNEKQIRFSGASSGALIATTLLCDIDMGEVTHMMLKIANTVKIQPNIDMVCLLRNLFDKCLPDDAHIQLRNRMYMSVTFITGMENGLITNYRSREHLIQCLTATSFVPGWFGWKPPVFDAKDFLDISNGIPQLPIDRETSDWSSETDEDSISNCSDRNKRKGSISSQDSKESCYEFSDCSDKEDELLKKDVKKTKKNIFQGYLDMLVRLCYLSLRTTSKVVRKVPGASTISGMVPSQIVGKLNSFMETLIPEPMSKRYAVIDGGFSDNTPTFDGNTIKVTAFSGESDICPRDLTALDFSLDLGRTYMHFSEDNMLRLHHATNPMDTEMCLKLCEEGYNDCLSFLNRKDLLCCKKHLMTRATISSSPCSIGHALCNCDICRSADTEIGTSLSCVDCHKTKQKALVSCLPDNVRREFELAIQEEKNRNAPTESSWNRLISLFSWCAFKQLANALLLANLTVGFYTWLLKLWDNMSSLSRNAVNGRFFLTLLKNLQDKC